MGALHATAHALQCAAVQPVLRLLNVGQSQRVVARGKRTSLEGAQSVGNDGKQRLMRHAVDTNLVDRPVLEQNKRGVRVLVVRVRRVLRVVKP